MALRWEIRGQSSNSLASWGCCEDERSLMARIARVVALETPYHVTHRGNHRSAVFFDDADRERYLAPLARHARLCGMQVGACCLMTNHAHLIMVGRQPHSPARAKQFRPHAPSAPGQSAAGMDATPVGQPLPLDGPRRPAAHAFASIRVHSRLPLSAPSAPSSSACPRKTSPASSSSSAPAP